MAPRKTPTARRVVGYVRISRDREDETSTTTQRAAIEAYCTTRGWQLVKVITEPGRSAFKASRKSRPGFREAMNLIASGAADAFVIWKVDRAARNTLDLLTFVYELEQHGAEFASVTEQFDTSTPMGRTTLTMVAALAELESAQKSDRATDWHRHRRISGAVPAGPAALGYRKPKPNVLEVDPKVAPLVRTAARRIIDGASVLSTVGLLNDAGHRITHRGLTTALQSPTLAGLVAVSSDVLPRRGGARVLDDAELVEGGWEPVLDRETWEQVSAVLAAPDRRTNSGNKLRWPLVPIVRCHCGASMRHHIDKYTTTKGQQQMGRLLCVDQSCLNGIGYGAVEEAVTAAVLELLDVETWRRMRTRAQRGAPPDAAKIEAKLAKLWSMVLDETIEVEAFEEAKLRWRGELAAATTPVVDLPDVDDVRAAWEGFTELQRHLVFRAAIKNLTIGTAKRRGGRGVDLSRVELDLV